jgi:nucleoid DNA-binding protein
MKKADIIKHVCEKSGIRSKDAALAIKALIKVIQNGLSDGESITLSGLGTFKMKNRKARNGRNIKTGEIIRVPAGYKVSFKPTIKFRKAVEKFSPKKPTK